jgi:transposase
MVKIGSGIGSLRWKINLDPIAAMTLYRHGYTLGAIAKHFDCSPGTVRKAVGQFPDYKRLAREQQASGRTTAAGRRTKGLTNTLAMQSAVEAWQFYLDGHSVPQIAAYYEVRSYSIRHAFHRHYGAEYKRLKRHDRERDRFFPRELAWQLFQDGLSLPDLASRFGVTRMAIHRALSRNNGYQKIVYERARVFDRAEAWKLYQQGWTTKRIGERFGYHAKTVQKILRREYDGYPDIAKANLVANLALGPTTRIAVRRGMKGARMMSPLVPSPPDLATISVAVVDNVPRQVPARGTTGIIECIGAECTDRNRSTGGLTNTATDSVADVALPV